MQIPIRRSDDQTTGGVDENGTEEALGGSLAPVRWLDYNLLALIARLALSLFEFLLIRTP